MASFVIKVLSVTLGLFFIFIGILKLSPIVSEDLYKEMRKQYIRMAKVFPLIGLTGWRPNAHMYRKFVAASEVTCGVILTVIPGPLKIAANIVMIVLMLNDVLAHCQIKDGHQRMSLPIVFILLLSCRLVIYYQERQRLKAAALEAQQKQTEQSNTQQTNTTDETKKSK